MFESWDDVQAAVTVLVAAFDPDDVPVPSVVPLSDQLQQITRKVVAATTLLARRVDEVEQWKRAGYATAAEYLAAKSGSSVGAARDVLTTSNKLAVLPVVDDALRAGKLSGAQAALVAVAAAAAPAQQSRLVNEAARCSLAELKTECLRTKAAADPDREATHQRSRESRCARSHVDGEGAWNFHARGPVDAGARVEATWQALIDKEFGKARAEGRREERAMYAFDAFVAAVDHEAGEPSTARRSVRHLGMIRVDLEALKRGIAGDDELCEITGLGPIPVATARDLLGESILDLVITKGIDVLHVTHLGRGPTAAQKVALLFQQPLCTVEGCARARCEIDHREDWSRTRHTRLDELDPQCRHHHRLKTYSGWALVEGSGGRAFVPADDPRHPKRKSPP